MPTLYNMRHSGDQYRCTKFTSDMDVESSYLCTEQECECPAGHRPTCRHREMLPKFIQREHVGDNWMYDYDRGGWIQTDMVIEELGGCTPSVPAREEATFLEGMSQSIKHTIIYHTDEPPLPITHVILNVSVPQVEPSPSPTPFRRRI